MKNKGWIALDIDGTITLDKYSIPSPVCAYLKGLQTEGWKIAIATGRSFHFASIALSTFDFPYVLLCQNGSVALEMPHKKIILKRYLQWDAIQHIEEAFEGIDSDFVVYMGIEKGDLCYFRPKRFSEDEAPMLETWQTTQKERWSAVDRFTKELIPEFPLVKCFGPAHRMKRIADRLKKLERFQVTLLRSPFDPDSSIVLITEKTACKGASLEEVFLKFGRGPLVIAAGDDENDVSLLKIADIKIAMSHAPRELQAFADIISPPTANMGIIQALQMAQDGNTRT
jgi:HAD superfamily hydrolase (TIGR01484 family)